MSLINLLEKLEKQLHEYKEKSDEIAKKEVLNTLKEIYGLFEEYKGPFEEEGIDLSPFMELIDELLKDPNYEKMEKGVELLKALREMLEIAYEKSYLQQLLDLSSRVEKLKEKLIK